MSDFQVGNKVTFIGGNIGPTPPPIGSVGTVVDAFTDVPNGGDTMRALMGLIGMDAGDPLLVTFDEGHTHATRGSKVDPVWSVTTNNVEKVSA